LHYNFWQNYILPTFLKAGLEKGKRKAIGRGQSLLRWLTVTTEHSVSVTNCSTQNGLRVNILGEKQLKFLPVLFRSIGQWNTSFSLEHFFSLILPLHIPRGKMPKCCQLDFHPTCVQEGFPVVCNKCTDATIKPKSLI